MKIKSLFLSLFICLCVSPFLKAATFKLAVGGVNNEYPLQVMETSDGGYLIVGYISIAAGGQTNEDGLAVKMDQNGNILWTKQMGGALEDRFYGCAELNNNYYLVGRTLNSIHGSYDAWVVKMDNAGNVIWQDNYGGGTYDAFYKVISLPNNQLLLTGCKDGNPMEQLANHYVVKIREDGTPIWENDYGSSQTDVSRQSVLATDGSILVAGFSYSTSVGLHDGTLLSLDSATGDTNWLKSYGNMGEDAFFGIMNTHDGNLLSHGAGRLSNSTNFRLIIAKMNLSGDVIWTRDYVLANSGLEYFGLAERALDNGFILTIQGGNNTTAIIKIDSVGNVEWNRSFSDVGNDLLQYTIPTSDNHYVSVGQTNSFGHGGYDIMVIKMDANGSMDSCCVASDSVIIRSPVPTVRSWNRANYFDSTNVASNITPQNINFTALNNCVSSSVNANFSATKSCEINEVYIKSSSDSTLPHIWNMGDGTIYQDSLSFIHIYGDTGVYQITLSITAPICLNSDTHKVNISITPPFTADVGVNDTTLCPKQTLLLNATYPNASYQWQDNSTSPTFLVKQSGIYWVDVIVNQCPVRDSVTINYFQGILDIGRDTILCFDTSLYTIYSSPPGISYLWSDGSVKPFLEVKPTGLYWLSMVDLNNCVQYDSVYVTFNTPQVSLGEDRTICLSENLIYNTRKEEFISYHWSTEETNPIIHVNKSGEYAVTITDENHCQASDTVQITVEGCSLFIPNSFTPNGDGIDDEFGAVGENILEYNLKIFNRWGQLVFESVNLNDKWDGTFGNTKADLGVYNYQLRYKFNIHKQTKQSYGTVTLVR